MIARGTAGGREPVGLFFAIDLVVLLLLNGYAPRIHVVVGGETASGCACPSCTAGNCIEKGGEACGGVQKGSVNALG